MHRALIVSSTYSSASGLPPLEAATRDAQGVFSWLSRAGFAEQNLVVAEAEPALRSRLDELALPDPSGHGQLVLYFSGYVAWPPTRPPALLLDAPRPIALGISRLTQWLQKCDSSAFVVIDCAPAMNAGAREALAEHLSQTFTELPGVTALVRVAGQAGGLSLGRLLSDEIEAPSAAHFRRVFERAKSDPTASVHLAFAPSAGADVLSRQVLGEPRTERHSTVLPPPPSHQSSQEPSRIQALQMQHASSEDSVTLRVSRGDVASPSSMLPPPGWSLPEVPVTRAPQAERTPKADAVSDYPESLPVRATAALAPAFLDGSSAGPHSGVRLHAAMELTPPGDSGVAPKASPALGEASRLVEQGQRLADAEDHWSAAGQFEEALRILGRDAPKERAEIHALLALQLDELGNVGEAVRHYEAAVELKPDDRQLSERLLALLCETGDFEHAECRQRELLQTTLAYDERATVWEGLVRLWQDTAKDLERALEITGEWLKEQPANAAAIVRSLELQRALGYHREAIETQTRAADTVQNPLERALRYVDAARDVCAYLRDADYAISLARKALEFDENSGDALEIAATLLAHEGRWDELSELYESLLLGCSSQERAVQFARELFALTSRVSDPHRVYHALENAASNHDSAFALRCALSQAYLAHGHFEHALYQAQCAVAAGPRAAAAYRAMYAVGAEIESPDLMYRAACALEYLGQASVHESMLADSRRPKGLLPVTQPLTSAEWQSGLLFPERNRSVDSFLSAIAKEAIALRLQGLKRSKQLPEMAPERRHDVEKSTTTLAKTLAWTARVLATPLPELYLVERAQAGLSHVRSERAITVASKAMGSGYSLTQLAFVWGRHLSLFREEQRLALFFPTVPELLGLLHAALEAVGAVARSDDPEIRRFASQLRKKLSPEKQESLRERALELENGADSAALSSHASAWLHSVAHTACRAGLLACGDLTTALELLSATGASDATHALATELMVYTMSEEYSTLRSRLGIAG